MTSETIYHYVRGKGWIPVPDPQDLGFEVIGPGPWYWVEVIFPEDSNNRWWEDNFKKQVTLEQGIKVINKCWERCADSIKVNGWRWRLRTVE